MGLYYYSVKDGFCFVGVQESPQPTFGLPSLPTGDCWPAEGFVELDGGYQVVVDCLEVVGFGFVELEFGVGEFEAGADAFFEAEEGYLVASFCYADGFGLYFNSFL